MSKTYETDYSFPVLIEIPSNLSLTTIPPSELRADVRGKGWDLLRFTLFRQRDSVVINSGIRIKRSISESELKRGVLDLLSTPGTNVIRVFPDHIDIELEETLSKNIPIVPLVNFTVNPSNGILVRNPYFEPDHVQVSGPKSLIERFDTITIEISEEDSSISSSVNSVHKIDQSKFPALNIMPSELQLHIDIERFSQKEWLVPLKIAEGSQDINLLPNKVLLKGQVGISRYDRYKPEDFFFYVNLPSTVDDNELVVKFEKLPSGVRYISHSPKTVEYYIKADSTELQE